tara:strand:+ start:645 stop:1238 length:594 start_codon:yes stop_codon:yes gene_type:complete
MYLLFLFFLSVFAKEFNVYVEPMKVYRDGTEIANYISNQLVFTQASQHIKMAKQKSQYGWEYIEDSNNVNVYNEKTIGHRFSGCDYHEDALGCSVKNNHYYLRTFLELRDDEALIIQHLFDSKARIISSATSSSKKIIQWIKQQEVNVVQTQGLMGSQTATSMPKEELPLKWEIPWRIFSNNFRQMSLRLWSGVKLR